MFKVLLPFLLLLHSGLTYAQVIPDWRVDNTVSNPTVITTDLLHDGTNTFLSFQNYDIRNTVYLQKIDQAGNLINFDSISYMYDECDQRFTMDANRSIYICGQRDSSSQPTKIKLVKTDSLLNTQWTIYPFNSNSDSYHSVRTAYSVFDNCIYVVSHHYASNGLYTAVVKIDTAGNILWSNDTLPSLGLNCIRFAIDNHGGIRLGGFFYNPGTDEDFTIFGLDANGGNYWSTALPALNDDRVEDLVIDDYDNIYAYGFYSSGPRARVIKLLSNGQHQWTSSLSNFQGVKITLDETGVYVAGTDSIFGSELSIAKVDTTGNVNFVLQFNIRASGIVKTIPDPNSNLYVCYTGDSSGIYHWSVSKFDPAGNILYTSNFRDSASTLSYPTSFYLLSEGFIVSGLMSNMISTVKFDESSVVSVKNNIEKNIGYWFDENTHTIHLKNIPDENFNFELFDASSKPIVRKSLSPGMNNITLPSLSKGIYFFRLINSGNLFSGKVFVR